ncbi:cef modifier of supressor tRNAs [Aeromonas phage Asfd_1]|nr:cef modifier of supressor tRNAs [Aeromonas phage Asfd_1]
MRISQEFFLNVMFSDKVVTIEKAFDDPGVSYTTVLYVFEGDTRIAVLERVITKPGTTWELKEGIYEELRAKI